MRRSAENNAEDDRSSRLVSFCKGTIVCDKSNAILKSYLRKEGKKMKSWKLRLFVLLSGGVVLYFRTPESERPKGGFVLGTSSSVARANGVLSIGSVKSYSDSALDCGRVFQLRAEPQELQSWEIAIQNAVSELGRIESELVHQPVPFSESTANFGSSGSGLSLSAQRSISDNEYFKRVNIEKLSRLLLMDDILLIMNWMSADSVPNIGAVVYKTCLGSLCDNVALCSMKTRQAIMRQWTKPVLKLNLTKDSNAPTVEIVDSEMVVNFRLENASSIGSDLEDIFKSEIVQ